MPGQGRRLLRVQRTFSVSRPQWAAPPAGVAETGSVDGVQQAAVSRPPIEAADAVRDAARLLPAVPPEASATVEPPSLGQSILESINAVRTQFDASATRIESMLNAQSPDMTVSDMLSVQMQITTFTLQQDLMGKIVGKATQNVDQMLKAQ